MAPSPTVRNDILEDKNVCIIGLGYVGLTLAVALAETGFSVSGIEINPEILASLRQGRAHFQETGLNARLRKNIAAGRLAFDDTINIGREATIYIITVGTPVDDDKRTRLEAIKSVAGDVASVLKENDLVILRSTVRVGVSQDVVKPVLDTAGVNYNLAFCPERTVEGKAIEELRSLPQVVGGLDTASALRASRFFHMLTPSVVRVSGLEAAEMVKLVNNTHRDVMFAFANEIASAAEAAGLSAIEVIKAANLGYPRGGVCLPGPVGGPCLEKDPYILAEGLAQHGYTPELSLASRRINETLPKRAVARIRNVLSERGVEVKRVALLGLAFKGRPETSDLRGTLAKPLYDELAKAFPDARIAAWDPVVDPAEALAGMDIAMAASLDDAVRNADLVVIQTNHRAFAEMDFPKLSGMMSTRALIYDLWAQNEAEELFLQNDVVYGCYGATQLTAAISQNGGA